MKEQYTIIDKGNYILIKVHSAITIDSIKAAVIEVAGDHNFKGKDRLWDLRECKIKDMGYDSVRELGKFVKFQYKEDGIKKKSALLVNDELMYGLSRMYEMTVDEIPFDVMVFKEYEKAIEWLK